MKKLKSTLLALVVLVTLTMCSKTEAVGDESAINDPVLENEKLTVDPSSIESELIELVNDHRASVGASALVVSSSSYVHAKDHNDYMISKNKLSHDNFEARANKIATEIDAIQVSENVARFYTSAEGTLEGWLDSDSHKNTLEGDFTHTTLSVQLDKQGRPYFTQIFMKVEAQ